jgi:hypothetical protein
MVAFAANDRQRADVRFDKLWNFYKHSSNNPSIQIYHYS